jgi:hypothetical protein
MPVEADGRLDAELTAILRRRVGVVAVESEEERPESGALNWDPMPCGPEALKAAGYERIFSEKVMSPRHAPAHATEAEGPLRDLGAGVIRTLVWTNLICCGLVGGSAISSRLASSSAFVGNVTPADYIGGWAYPSPNIIMVIAWNRQHMVAINNPNYLKHMMSFDANGAGTGTVQRATSIQPVASNIELRTIASSQVLPHPPATPLCGPLSRVQLQSLLVPLPSATLLSGNLFPNQPTPDEDNSNHQAHKFDGRGNNTPHRNELHKFGLPWWGQRQRQWG